MRITCKNCKTTKIVKNGKRGGKQRYLCRLCGYVWEHGKGRMVNREDNMVLLDEYVRDEVKYRQMSLSENVSIPTIQKRLDRIEFNKNFLRILSLEK